MMQLVSLPRKPIAISFAAPSRARASGWATLAHAINNTKRPAPMTTPAIRGTFLAIEITGREWVSSSRAKLCLVSIRVLLLELARQNVNRGAA